MLLRIATCCLVALALVCAELDGGLIISTPPIEKGFDPYAVLGVKRSAKTAQLNRAYKGARRAVASLIDEHPDIQEKRREEVELAYAVLTDEGRRAEYDLNNPAPEGEAEDEQEL